MKKPNDSLKVASSNVIFILTATLLPATVSFFSPLGGTKVENVQIINIVALHKTNVLMCVYSRKYIIVETVDIALPGLYGFLLLLLLLIS